MKAILPSVLAIGWLAPLVHAYIEAAHPLGRICSESTNIVVMQVQRVDREKNLIIYSKIKDLKGKHPTEQIKHNIGQKGHNEREWKTVMAWVKEGRRAVFFHNGQASVTGIDDYWYQCFAEGQWWAMSHAEPFLLRTYWGSADRLAVAVMEILAGKEVVVPAMVDGPAEQFHLRTGKVRRIRASLKRIDFDAKRDFVAMGRIEGKEPDAVAMLGLSAAAARPQEQSAAPTPAPAGPASVLTVDRAKRRVVLTGAVAPRKLAHLSEVYPIEVIATWPAPDGQKAHETVVTFSGVKPSEVHTALEKIGLKPGRPARGEEGTASGPTVKIFLEFADKAGQPRRIPIEQALVDRKTGKPIAPVKWHFTGSSQRRPDPEKDEQVYGADVTGTLVGVFPVTDDLVIQSSLTMKDEPNLKLEINKAVLPAEGTAVKLMIQAE